MSWLDVFRGLMGPGQPGGARLDAGFAAEAQEFLTAIGT